MFYIYLPPFVILLIATLLFPKPIFVLAATVTWYFVECRSLEMLYDRTDESVWEQFQNSLENEELER